MTFLPKARTQSAAWIGFLLMLCWSLCLPGFVCAQTSGSEKTDFTGTWELDLEASDSMEEILKAQGRSWAERKAAGNMSVTQRITQTKDQMTIAIDSVANKSTEVLRLDGTAETKETPKMGTVQTHTSWDGDSVLVTVVDMKLSDGDPATMVMRRQLRDQGKTMVMQIEMRLKDGKVLSANRILRRS